MDDPRRPDDDAGQPEEGPPAPQRPAPRAYSYGTRDVQPGYETQGPNPTQEPWGRDPWADED